MTRFLGPLPLENLLLAARAAFLVFSFVLAAFSFTRWRRAAERDTVATAEQLACALERLERLEASLAQLEPHLAALGEQIDTRFKAAAAAGGSASSYPIAIRLARAGAQPEELIASCGLTRQEAELVARLHGRSGDPHALAWRTHRGHPAAA
ncbi:MAG TPA: DUF2802 domain-containing protein [Steroidobacteraceae bacterium]|nr:DUF2802 domain-containing protein [Steroidobacteraceae bacterium]